MYRDRLAHFGRRIFGKRLSVGLVFALVGLAVLCPRPLFDPRYLPGQIMGLGAIVAGLFVRAWGSGYAGRHTRSGTIEAPRLVTAGPFAHLRNPIYAGSILLGIGMSALIGDPLAYLFTALAFAFLYFGIVPAEEEFLDRQFGSEYRRYRQAVPRLIPRLRPWPGRVEARFQWRAVRGESFIAGLLVVIYSALRFEEYLATLFG